MAKGLNKGSIKLSFTTTFELEVAGEEELQAAIRNMPWLGNTKPMGFTSGQNNVRVIESKPLLSLADGERENIIAALDGCSTKTAAAKTLGIQRCTLLKKIKQYGL